MLQLLQSFSPLFLCWELLRQLLISKLGLPPPRRKGVERGRCRRVEPAPQDYYLYGRQGVEHRVRTEAHHRGHPQAAVRGAADNQLLDDGKTLGECGFTSQTARPQAPATVGLAFRADDTFEALRIEPFSSPPELPDVMKPQDSGGSANEQAVQ